MLRQANYFNPRSPRGERRGFASGSTTAYIFQSTLPAWGATERGREGNVVRDYFNPRSPRGERPPYAANTPSSTIFQSTLPAWGATSSALASPVYVSISIHAPRVGSDAESKSAGLSHDGISIHAPRVGSDRGNGDGCTVPNLFQSTLPAWGATMLGVVEEIYNQFQSPLPAWGATQLRRGDADRRSISIHAPRVGSDLTDIYTAIRRLQYFNPRSPRGERRRCRRFLPDIHGISIHAPRVGSDRGQGYPGAQGLHFNPRSPRGERLP